MNARQKHAVAMLRGHIEDRLTEHDRDHYGAAITKFTTQATDYGTYWVSAETEYTKLPETNLLRAVSHERWFVHIGPRGAVEAKIYPKSYEQFKGKRVFNFINVK